MCEVAWRGLDSSVGAEAAGPVGMRMLLEGFQQPACSSDAESGPGATEQWAGGESRSEEGGEGVISFQRLWWLGAGSGRSVPQGGSAGSFAGHRQLPTVVCPVRTSPYRTLQES